jgi:hypothetical protein
MRILATFGMQSRLGDGNQIFLRTHKTGKPLFTWIPDWLMERLQDTPAEDRQPQLARIWIDVRQLGVYYFQLGSKREIPATEGGFV